MRHAGTGTQGSAFSMRQALVISGLSWTILCTVTSAQVTQSHVTRKSNTSGFSLEAPRTVPGGPLLRTNGLSMTLEKRDGAGLHGYHECDLHVAAKSPSREVRIVTVRVQVTDSWFNWSNDKGSLAVTRDVVLPPGVTRAATKVLIPEYRQWNNIKIDVWDDGQELPDMSAQQYLTFATNEGGTRILAIGSRGDFPDGGGDKWDYVTAIAPGELPDNWLAYTSLDVVVMNLAQLGEIVEKHPRRFAALRAWVTTGGNLWIYNVPANDQRRDELTALLDPLPERAAPDSGASTERWRDPDPNVSVNRGKFVWRPLGCGVVVAIETKRPRTGNVSWSLVGDCGGQGRTDWQSRHGVSFTGSNNDFWTLTIPGVGLPPIKTFYILITVFVVAIGPVNYMLLRRRHRLNLMVVTVPVSAALVSGGLLVYALAADGLDTRMRTRSFTRIDQRRGEAVCWSRLSYYSGRARSAGLKFATDTAVYPLEADSSRSSGKRPTREISWTDEQHLGRGWLLARTSTQLVTVRHRATDTRLEIDERDGGPPRVVNHLGGHIEKLWLVDADGHWYEWTGRETDGALAFVATDFNTFKNEWQKVYHATALRYPDDVHSGWTTGNFFSTFAPPGVGSAESILECSMAQSLDERSRRSYVAVTDGSAELQRGLEPDSETQDFHVIVGQW